MAPDLLSCVIATFLSGYCPLLGMVVFPRHGLQVNRPNEQRADHRPRLFCVHLNEHRFPPGFPLEQRLAGVLCLRRLKPMIITSRRDSAAFFPTPNSQAMKNLGPDSIYNVTSTYELDSASTYTYTWNVTFSAAMGDVPEMTIGEANADLSSVGADVTVGTVQVT